MGKLLLNGSSLGNIKGILFDKDGTLSDSENYLIQLAQSRLDESIKLLRTNSASEEEISIFQNLLISIYGLTPSGIRPEGTIAVGSRNQNLISTATAFSLIGKDWSDSMEFANQAFENTDNMKREEFNDATSARSLLPGAKEFLEKLFQANIKCALISNDNNEGIITFLTMNKIDQFIHSYWSAEDKPGKPDPKAVYGICKKLGLNPSDCALIGDANADLMMAKRAKVGILLGYIAGWSNPPKLADYQYLISHWEQISIEPSFTVEPYLDKK